MAVSAESARLIVRIRGDIKQLEKSLTTAQNEVDKTASKIEDRLDKMANTIKATLAGATAIATVGVAAYGRFDKAMTESTAIMGGMEGITDDQRKRMEELALSLSTKSTKGPSELARSYFFLASAGKDAEQSMKLLPAVTKFAQAGAFDMALATDLLTDAQSALGLTSKDSATDLKNLARISDVLVGANSLANASTQQFSESLTNDAATAGREFGQSLEEIVGILSVYADKGKKGAEAGNLYGRAVRLLVKASQENAEVFESMNIPLTNKLTGAYRPLRMIIKDMEKAFEGMTDSQRDSALEQLGFAALARKSILPLLGAADAASGYTDKLNGLGGVTDEITKRQMKAFLNQLQVLKNRLEVVAIELGRHMVPVAVVLMDTIKLLIAAWTDLPEIIKRVIGTLIGILAVIGPVALAFMGLKALLPLVVLLFKRLAFSIITLIPRLISLRGALAVGAFFLAKFAAGLLGVAKHADKLNRETEKATRLNQSVADSYKESMKAAIKEAKAIENVEERQKKLSAILTTVNKDLDSQKGSLEAAEKALDKVKSGFFSVASNKVGKLFGAGDTFQTQKNQIEQFNTRLATMREISKEAADALSQVEVALKNVGSRAIVKIDIDKLTHAFKEQAENIGLTARQIEILNVARKGATKEELRGLILKDKEISQQERILELMEQGRSLTQTLSSPQEKFNQKVMELDELLDVGAIKFDIYQKAVKDAEEQILNADKAATDARSSFISFHAAAFGSAEALQRIQQQRDRFSEQRVVPKFSMSEGIIGNKRKQLEEINLLQRYIELQEKILKQRKSISSTVGPPLDPSSIQFLKEQIKKTEQEIEEIKKRLPASRAKDIERIEKDSGIIEDKEREDRLKRRMQILESRVRKEIEKDLPIELRGTPSAETRIQDEVKRRLDAETSKPKEPTKADARLEEERRRAEQTQEVLKEIRDLLKAESKKPQRDIRSGAIGR